MIGIGGGKATRGKCHDERGVKRRRRRLLLSNWPVHAIGRRIAGPS